MSQDREILASRIINASRERAFDAWLDPKQVGEWWGPNGFKTTTHTMDVRPGGVWEFIMHGPNGIDYKNKIVYVEIAKPERLIYDHVSGPLFRMTATFEDLAGKTKVTMKMVFETAAQRERTAKMGAIEGAKQHLERLEFCLSKP